jgi:hypothetical protein
MNVTSLNNKVGGGGIASLIILDSIHSIFTHVGKKSSFVIGRAGDMQTNISERQEFI